MKFSTHGKISAEYNVDSGIVHIYITVPVNEEFMVEYESALAPIRSRLEKQNWTSIEHIKGEALIPASMSALVKRSILRAVEHGLYATAVIFYSESGKSVFEDFWDKIYGELNVKHGFFDNEEQAEKWLLASLAKLHE